MPDAANATTGTTSLHDAIAEVMLSSWSESQLSSFLARLVTSSHKFLYLSH